MSKRFTESTKFRDAWYRKLKPKHKCLWEFMLAECNLAGIIEIDFESMSFHIGDKITKEDLNVFEDKLVYLTNDKVFIQKFILFQQGELNENNRAHTNIIKSLDDISLDYKAPIKDLKRVFEGANKELQSSHSNSNSNSNSKCLDKCKSKKENYAEFVKMTNEEYLKLVNESGEAEARDWIERLNEYKGSKGKQYKNDYLTIKSWIRKDLKDNPNKHRSGLSIGRILEDDDDEEKEVRGFISEK